MIFHTYVSLPEGTHLSRQYLLYQHVNILNAGIITLHDPILSNIAQYYLTLSSIVNSYPNITRSQNGPKYVFLSPTIPWFVYFLIFVRWDYPIVIFHVILARPFAHSGIGSMGCMVTM